MTSYYIWGRTERINSEFLRQLSREFECRGQKYKVGIFPAKIKDADQISGMAKPA